MCLYVNSKCKCYSIEIYYFIWGPVIKKTGTCCATEGQNVGGATNGPSLHYRRLLNWNKWISEY